MGTQRRDYIYVKDAARACVALLFGQVTGAVNIGTGEAVEVATLARSIGHLMDRADLVHFGARTATLLEPPLVVASLRRLRNELGWSPIYSLGEGISESIQCWKQLIKAECNRIPNAMDNLHESGN